MGNVTYPVAFLAGFISFFAPCAIPLIPVYVGYVVGASAGDLEKKGYNAGYLKKILISSILYIAGFTLVFVLFGLTAAGLGVILRRWDFLIRRLGGALIILFGLEIAGFLSVPLLARQKGFSLPGWVKRMGYLKAFFVGIIFATTWTPCIGVILGSILSLAAVSETLAEGAKLLFLYSLGISFPFMIVSLTLASIPKYIHSLGKSAALISKIGGLLLAILGFMLATDTYKYFNAWLFELAYFVGYRIH